MFANKMLAVMQHRHHARGCHDWQPPDLEVLLQCLLQIATFGICPIQVPECHTHSGCAIAQVEGTSVSLADLLSGNAGSRMELGDPRLEGLFTNEYLPDKSQT